MNIAFAVSVAVLGGICGLFFSMRLKEREKILSAVLLLIKEISVKIRYTNSEMVEIFAASSQNPEYKELCFVRCYYPDNNDKNYNFHLLWQEGVKRQPYINQRDKELLMGLGENLGQTDTEGQLSFLELYFDLMKNQLEQAKKEYTDKGKMYRSVGLLCGLAVGIMIL